MRFTAYEEFKKIQENAYEFTTHSTIRCIYMEFMRIEFVKIDLIRCGFVWIPYEFDEFPANMWIYFKIGEFHINQNQLELTTSIFNSSNRIQMNENDVTEILVHCR